MRDWWIACQRAGSHVRSSRVVCRTLITLMNGVGCASRYRRFTASVTLTIPKREGQSTQGAEKKRRRQKKKGRFDACWHYPSVLSSFHGAHKANWIRTSTLHWILFTAGRASFITFFVLPPRNRTLHIWHMTHSNTHGRRNTLAQLHFHCGSRWQKPHNKCLLVVCACVWACARVCVECMREEWGGMRRGAGMNSSLLPASCKGRDRESWGFVCVITCVRARQSEKRENMMKPTLKIRKRIIFRHLRVCVCVCAFHIFVYKSKSRVPRDWFSLCFPRSHHQRETRWSWIQLGRPGPDTAVIKQTGGEEMRTSTRAAASALSSIALSPSCLFPVDVRDVCTKRGGWQVWLVGPESSSISSVQYIQEKQVDTCSIVPKSRNNVSVH